MSHLMYCLTFTFPFNVHETSNSHLPQQSPFTTTVGSWGGLEDHPRRGKSNHTNE